MAEQSTPVSLLKDAHRRMAHLGKHEALGAYDADQLIEDARIVSNALEETQRRVDMAEGTVRGMIDALRSVFPPGFRGDNPVWACGKLADEFDDRSAMLARAADELSTLRATLERQERELATWVAAVRALKREYDTPVPFFDPDLWGAARDALFALLMARGEGEG